MCLKWPMADDPSADLLIRDARIVPFRFRTELGALRRARSPAPWPRRHPRLSPLMCVSRPAGSSRWGGG